MGKKTLGLDLGIASIGWCLFEDDEDGNPKKIIDLGSYVFDQIEDNKGKTENIVRRQKRLMRRQRRRRVTRLEEGRNLFAKYFGLDFFNDVIAKLPVSFNEDGTPTTPFQLKVKGLTELLTKEELCIALYHYLKFRGFKSNRKSEKPKNNDDKKLLPIMEAFKNKHYQEGKPFYPTVCLLKDFAERSKNGIGAKIHNDPDHFYLTVRREWYEPEIRALLDKQKEFGLVSDEFIADFMDLWSRQRDCSYGPAEGSPYYVKPVDKIGKCIFDEKPRAFKDTITAKRFVLLSALNNFSYKTSPEQKEYSRLTPEQIEKAEKGCLFAKTITYEQLLKKVGIDPDKILDVKGLHVGKKKFDESLKTFCEENGIETMQIPSDKLGDFYKFHKRKTLGKSYFYKGSDALSLIGKKERFKNAGDDCIDALISAFGLYKTDDTLRNCLHLEDEEKDKKDQPLEIEVKSKLRALNLSETEISDVLDFDVNVSGTIDLSLGLCKKLIPEMRKGFTYDKAMANIGYSHTSLRQNNDQMRMPELDVCLQETKQTLTNPVVRNTLVRMRRIINAIIDRYGFFDDCAIELGREIKKNSNDRLKLQGEQLDNLSNNDRYRNEMIEKYPGLFKSYGNISRQKNSLLKYRLYCEQRGVSPYTNESIKASYLFDDGWYEIDHILPYSRSFDDSISNKVLVEARCNQEKRNRTPLEWLNTEEKSAPLYAYLNSHAIEPGKRRKLLATKISDDFLNKDSTDNAYIARLARQLITYYVLPKGVQCRSVSGGITAKLRDIWGLSGHTHSYLAYDDYKAKPMSKYVYQGMEKENNKKSLVFKYKFDNAKEPLPFKVEPHSINKEGSKDDEKKFLHNKMLKLFLSDEFYPYFYEKFNDLKGIATGVDELQEAISAQSNNPNDSERRECGIYILSCLRRKIQKDSNEKDRSNHLHHALDAAVIACSNPRLIQRITKAYQKHEECSPEYDENGEIRFPYRNFREEVLIRVYERDKQTLISKLNALSNYKDEPATDKTVHVLIPARSPKTNVSGPISKETILGVNDCGQTVHKISVKKLNFDKLEKIEHRESGSKAIYEACKKWLEKEESNRGEYPVIGKNMGTPVKYIRIVEGIAKDKVDLSDGKYAENDEVIRVDVYQKRDGGDIYYFVPIYYWQILKNKQSRQSKNKSEILYTLFWGRDDQNCQINSDSLENGYKLLYRIPRYSLLELDYLPRGKSPINFICYSGGLSKGLFEIYSPLGDGYDLEFNGDRFLLTISQIKKIKVKSISVLGKIS